MPTVIKTLIVDDEQDSRDSMAALLTQSPFPFDIVGFAPGAQNGIELIIDQQPELVFLDINLPGKDGFWLAQKLRKLKFPINIIFITAFNEYAEQAFRYAAFDFLTKPIEVHRLNETIRRYLSERADNKFTEKLDRLKKFLDQKKLKIPTPDGYKLIPHDQIIYCEADGNYTHLFLANGIKQVICNQMGKLEESLDDTNFVRANRSALINTMYVEEFARREKAIILTDTLQKYSIKLSSSGIKKLKELGL
ncbi:MAG: hypothetical protein A2W85_18530 [Bacteroidetes bacterium GWF2_41_31]|nr:MAG: hypothetical protein A2W85_18530 [Bacteroidetes bacterium GWF2_41_31]